MKATAAKLLSLLQKSLQFVIPIAHAPGNQRPILAVEKEADRQLDGLLKGSK